MLRLLVFAGSAVLLAAGCTPSAPVATPAATPTVVATVPVEEEPPAEWPVPAFDEGLHFAEEYAELSPSLRHDADEEWRLWFRDQPRRIVVHLWRRGGRHGGAVRLWWTPASHDYDYEELRDWVDCRERERHGGAAESCDVHLPELDWKATMGKVASAPRLVALEVDEVNSYPLLLIEHRQGARITQTLVENAEANEDTLALRKLLFDIASEAEWPYDADGNPIKTTPPG